MVELAWKQCDCSKCYFEPNQEASCAIERERTSSKKEYVGSCRRDEAQWVWCSVIPPRYPAGCERRLCDGSGSVRESSEGIECAQPKPICREVGAELALLCRKLRSDGERDEGVTGEGWRTKAAEGVRAEYGVEVPGRGELSDVLLRYVRMRTG
ncbi:monooxygenase [Pseudozyma hubeiensis SY62]|uniref:Monooxygenase n=1 Tax=Pseudozyma hubeiensis (strain SY62) TaxID=1305764 RepID=R9P6M6_PSEHS|nr:monooxygenase [Pseudozyma hubeiensis SY62]GAC96877.1 monooxygenase [Pseudozyma hubeiensis SY62]